MEPELAEGTWCAKMSTSPTVTSSVRFPPTSGKTTITTSSIASKKTENTSSSSSTRSQVSTGVKQASSVPAKISQPTTGHVKEATTSASASKVQGAKGAFTRAKTIVGLDVSSAESSRMKQDRERIANWKRWGPYLSERQWATVREDYSPYGNW